MINKQNLWFLTLFSLILVLSVYYITMPNELLLTNNSNYTEKDDDKTKDTKKTNKDTEAVIEESEILVALRVSLEEEREAVKADLQGLLTNKDVTTEEKNNAYEQLKELNLITGYEQTLEDKIKKAYNFPTFIKIDGNEITVVIDNDKHDSKLANDIMRSVQQEFKDKKYITVQFK